MAGPPLNPSCDRCRSRKVKCTPLNDEELVLARARRVGNRCRGCFRAGKDCTHDYVHKKPGRPLGSGAPSSTRTPRKHLSPSHQRDNPTSPRPNASTVNLLSPESLVNDPLSFPKTTAIGGVTDSANTFLAESISGPSGPATGSIFGSARSTFYPTPYPYAQPPPPLLIDPGTSLLPEMGTGSASYLPNNQGQSAQQQYDNPGPYLADSQRGPSTGESWLSDPIAPGSSSQAIFEGGGDSFSTSLSGDPVIRSHPRAYELALKLEDIVSWTDVCFFVSLFLKHQHCLVPLVHKPTFAQDVLYRRDQRDEAFRGLLCSMVAYSICQCPISLMTESYTRPKLETILRRCRKASTVIRQRQQMSPSLVLITSTILDWITAQAVGKPQICDILVAETTRLAHALGLNDPMPRAGTNCVEREVCRRLYWTVYAKDKTDALNGRPIILHDFEGVPPLPLEIDDDYVSTEGTLNQPGGKTSYMTGFVAISRIFQVLAHCINRQRAFSNQASLDPDIAGDRDTHLRWIEAAQDRIRDLLDSLPPALRMDLTNDYQENGAFSERSLFGIQQANITITALCAEFALLDFRASLRPEEDTSAAREEMAQKAYSTMSGIPIEYLASNGESMRGKVLRIVLALLSMSTEGLTFSQNVWDWWNMYSRVQFLQVIPDETMAILSRRPSPEPASA